VVGAWKTQLLPAVATSNGVAMVTSEGGEEKEEEARRV